ncbi:hypothetical protein GJ496_002401 [Pomphorhynchus laevis]|nr:hypothetical protein GJ496_002401 [Pomphorhynchus laevis]
MTLLGLEFSTDIPQRELHAYSSCHTGSDVPVCEEIVRIWRRVEGSAKIVDLKNAYLQIHVAKEFRKYQLVYYYNHTYCLTRIGFGLCIAPRIISLILKEILSRDIKIKYGTSACMDDILVNENIVSADYLMQH